ncbi:MAG: RteC domain-containing protein [Mucilaginibacter sp.]|uniref:RteC domain-containing protein n=1 Tax=Mucilaginibacter sp. TaxID=1882438 RepID=UPI003262D5A8
MGFLNVLTDKEADPVKRLSQALQEIKTVLQQLREKVLSRPFPSKETEISFFKNIKPKFYAWRIFHLELYNLDMNKPAGTRDMLLAFYKHELGLVERFFKLNAFLYHYFKAGFSEMDGMYFIRGAEIPTVLQPEIPDADQQFSTGMDYLYARFMAFEMLQKEILDRMNGLDGTLHPVEPKKPKPVPTLKWTGSHVNLVELVYGLYYTMQLNNGHADVTEIVNLMEDTFGIKLRDAHHSFVEIRRRKVDSPSRFLEQMAAAIQQRVEDDLDYKPQLKKALKAQKEGD